MSSPFDHADFAAGAAVIVVESSESFDEIGNGFGYVLTGGKDIGTLAVARIIPASYGLMAVDSATNMGGNIAKMLSFAGLVYPAGHPANENVPLTWNEVIQRMPLMERKVWLCRFGGIG